MVQAYILIQTEVGAAREVASTIREISGVVRADAVTGPYDVVVLAEANGLEELNNLVGSKLQPLPGIIRTLTCSVAHL